MSNVVDDLTSSKSLTPFPFEEVKNLGVSPREGIHLQYQEQQQAPRNQSMYTRTRTSALWIKAPLTPGIMEGAKYLAPLGDATYLFSSPEHGPLVPWCFPRITQPGTEIRISDNQRYDRRSEF